MEASANIHSTVKQSKWDGITHKQQVSVDNKRTMLSTEGIPFLKLKHTNVWTTDRGRGTQLTLGTYYNGQGSV